MFKKLCKKFILLFFVATSMCSAMMENHTQYGKSTSSSSRMRPTSPSYVPQSQIHAGATQKHAQRSNQPKLHDLRKQKPSPLKQATTITPPQKAERRVEKKNSPPPLIRPTVHRYPENYAQRTYVTLDEWEQLPIHERTKWAWDKWTDEEKVNSLWSQPFSVYMKRLVRAEEVQKRHEAYELKRRLNKEAQ